jgi:tRNA threonylcarbamoyladenosine biosynthesis protein TsaB
MALILSLETSTDICSVALHDDQRLIITSEVHLGQSHASKLAILVDHVLNVSNHKANELHAVAVSSGPGSYTGLRIGASLAKGMCFTLELHLISVDTLKLMTTQVKNVLDFKDHLFCPMIDARRMDVYCLLMHPNGNVVLPVEARTIDEESFLHFLRENKIVFFGNGASKCRKVITDENAVFFEGIYPKASAMGPLAFELYKNNTFEDVSNYEPFYLKQFVAKKPKTDMIFTQNKN